VLTGNYRDEEDCNHPVQHVLDQILMQLRVKLGVAAKPPTCDNRPTA
jgi:hypothetical protein